MSKMNVGDKVRYIDEANRLSEFFKLGEVYTVESSELLWSNENYWGQDAKKFTFAEVPEYTWTCQQFFEDVE